MFRAPGKLVRKWRATGSLRSALELARLEALPRYQGTTTRILGSPTLALPDGPSFAFMYDEIFRRRIYGFETPETAPLIIDGGANIGLSVLFFKRHHPGARVVAFEADPAVFKYLEQNVVAAALHKVELHNEALWTENGTVAFSREGADAGRMIPIAGRETITVRSVRLRDWLEDPVELLKLDIEGAEFDVLRDCADRLSNVARIFVEYHSFEGRRQFLPELLALLRDSGFRFWMDSPVSTDRPFVRPAGYLGMDLQLNIFAWRSVP